MNSIVVFLILLQSAGVDIKELTFMIDKSVTERSAISSLGARYILCSFHVFQEVERWLKTTQSGLSGTKNKAQRLLVLYRLRQLLHIDDEDLFKVKEKEFKFWLEENTWEVGVSYYQEHWEGDSKYWAAYGRKHVRHLASNTNNLIERFFGLIKYTFMVGKVKQRMEDLVKLFVYVIVPHYIKDRRKTQGDAQARTVAIDKKHIAAVKYLCETTGAMFITDKTIGLGRISKTSKGSVGNYQVCVADLSCECEANVDDACKHIEAAAKLSPLTESAMRAAAAEIKRSNCWRPLNAEGDKESTMFECPPLASNFANNMAGTSNSTGFSNRTESRRSRCCLINVLEGTCTCHAYAKFGVCCHLIAACSEDESDSMVEAYFPTSEEGALPSLNVERRRRYKPLTSGDKDRD